MKCMWLIPVLLLFWVSSYAQRCSSDSKRAIRRFEEAVAFYRKVDLDGAESCLLKALRSDENFIEAYQLISQVCYESGRIDKAIYYYSRGLEVDPQGNPDGYRLLAGLTIQTGDYARTLELVEKFLSFPPEQVNFRESGILLKEKCLFAIEAMKNPVPFQPENLGDSVNSVYSEYWPCLSVDEQLLMFTVMMPRDPAAALLPGNLQEDFYFVVRKGDSWSGRASAGPPLNTPDNEGAHTMTADGKTLYFTACNRRDGKGQCDIYRSEWRGDQWGEPENIGSPVNSRYSEKHPTISADGRMLLFTSNRPGGKGSFDIWASVRESGGWSVPVNLGDSVNTGGLEQSPFLHPDGRSLYFSSTGWPGMGQGDLFLSRLDGDHHWSRPVNLGYPVNTYNDEIGLTVNATGNTAYFASDRGRGTDTDIYTFELPPAVRPVLVSYLAGRVFDARTMKGLSAVIQLIDLETEEVVMETASGPGEGDYLVSLPTDRDYALNVSAEGYLFYSAHFSFTGEHSHKEPFRRDIPMEKIGIGSSVVLNNIFFNTDSHQLLAASLAELNRVAAFLNENPSLAVEIGGHTDSTGSAEHNQELSEKRAGAVVDFLKGKGIQPSRLYPAGYGDREPVSGNDTEEGRAQNRRTEMKIMKIVR
jgi:outer membrane protein OmpA-like peptidoglycan-associated protein/Tol biopolymer transport system component